MTATPKATDAITSRMTKSISSKRDENPAYYDSFSKRIKEALELYKEKVISEAEYLAKMRTIMEDYHAGKSTISYPERIKSNVHAQAFYGVITAILDDEIDINENIDIISDVSLEVTSIIQKHDTVDWQTNKEIHNKIAQDIDDMFYRLEKENGFVIDFDTNGILPPFISLYLHFIRITHTLQHFLFLFFINNLLGV